ncbi:MAG TPA: M15 family metallopeptidase [Solirubrobacterales bacterium]|nr:M15 family metallopeptidase [Solirubrobacterales bacterium]
MSRSRYALPAPALIAVLLLAWFQPAEGSPVSPTPAFEGRATRIGPELRERMTGASWRPGCPVGFSKLRLLRVTHWGFDGKVRRGRLVVHRDSARGMLGVMRKLYRLRFPIRRMRLVDAYGADDRRSMAADNTSAFNCRFVAGTSRWSEHAFGHAIDVNPVENPYVTADGYVSPPAGAPYVDRSQQAKGLIHRRGPVVAAFAAIGWEWGGNWSWPKDYQHFSAGGN